MEKGKCETGNTGTPAANAASRKKGNTPGSQRGRRENEKAASRNDLGRQDDQDWGSTGIGGV